MRADAIEASSMITVTFDAVEDKAEAINVFMFIAGVTEAELEIAEAIEASSTITAVIEAEEETEELKALVQLIDAVTEPELEIAAEIG